MANFVKTKNRKLVKFHINCYQSNK